MMKLLLVENIRISLGSVRSHLLRSLLTMLIISFGIMALIGTMTVIDSLKLSISENFATMGANTFTIRNVSMFVHDGEERTEYKSITQGEAWEFKSRYTFTDQVSVFFFATGIATAKAGTNKTNPNIQVIGTDDNYMATAGYELASGRNFSVPEAHEGRQVVIIGPEVNSKLFPGSDGLGKTVRLGPGKFRIIGVLKSKGSAMGFNGDRTCIVPLAVAVKQWSRSGQSFDINVKAAGAEELDPLIGEATGLFRNIRRLAPDQKENFEVIKSDSLASMLIENTRYVTLAATIIGLITLIGAAIGLMNSMLVSVTERTREIGIRKATGATSLAIRNQFLIEAIVIGLLGGLIGILIGLVLGNSVAAMLGSLFSIPWLWIVIGIVLCIIVGLVSGLYPAMKASRTDPIESLRYE